MSFMQKQVERMKAWHVETSCGTECVPYDLIGSNINACRDYLEGKPYMDDENQIEAELVEGWFARLSAPGYMDCTEWSGPHDTEAEALAALDEMYPDDESEV